jgi:pimeloyl-ACP methyl ester carboxylesterase
MKLFFLYVLLLLIMPNTIAQPITSDDSIPSGKNFNKACFRLWYQQDIGCINGVIVLVPGSNGDGRDMVKDTSWQNFANQHNLALLGCFYTDYAHDNMAIEEYANAKEGSGEALLDVLQQFAKKTGHIELSGSPLFLWGISAGGEFNYEFVCWKPERVAAFVVNKGGVYFTALCSQEARKVPGLFFTGEKDLEFRNRIIEGIFTINRRFGAPWAFAEEPCIKHEIGQSQTLSIKYFDDILQMRMPGSERKSHHPVKLQPAFLENGYIGDFQLKEYVPFNEWKNSDYPTAWLPSQAFAEAWLSLIKRGCDN